MLRFRVDVSGSARKAGGRDGPTIVTQSTTTSADQPANASDATHTHLAGNQKSFAGQSLKVLFISPQPFFRIRGTPINIRNVITALAEDGHEVDLLCYPFGEETTLPPGIRILRSPSVPGITDVKVGPSAAKIPLDGFMAIKTFWLLLRKRYDVVHAVEESVFFASLFNRIWGRKLIYDMDSCISDQLAYSGKLKPEGKGVRFIEWMERRAIRRSHRVLTVCDSLSQVVRRLEPSAEIVQIEDAPLEKEFVDDANGAQELAVELRLGDHARVVYTGNFESYQGVDLLVDAGIELAKAGVSAQYILVGGRPDQVDLLSERVKAAGVEDAFRFTGLRPIEEMPAFMSLAHILVSPRSEGTNTALKIYGYMQSGRPIVATNLETHTQVLDLDCAMLTEPNAADIARGIRQVLALSDRGRSLGLAAKKRVDETYSLTQFKQRVQAMYRAL